MKLSQKVAQNKREKELESEISTLESLLRRARKELQDLKIHMVPLPKKKRKGESIADWVVGC